MSEGGFRRAIAEARFAADRAGVFKAGGRSIHQYWTLLSPHFRDVFLAPQRRSDDAGVSWTWREPAQGKPLTASELGLVRDRLEKAKESFNANPVNALSAQGRGVASQEIIDQVAARVKAMSDGLSAKNDAALAEYVCRTEGGVMVHSWGLSSVAKISYPDSSETGVTGVVLVDGKGSVGNDLVIENMAGLRVARAMSGENGQFVFPKLRPGQYRIRVLSSSGQFDEKGVTVDVHEGEMARAELIARDKSGEEAVRTEKSAGEGPQNSHSKRNRRWLWILVVLGAAGLVIGFFLWRGRAGSAVENTGITLSRMTPERYDAGVGEHRGDSSQPGDGPLGVHADGAADGVTGAQAVNGLARDGAASRGFEAGPTRRGPRIELSTTPVHGPAEEPGQTQGGEAAAQEASMQSGTGAAGGIVQEATQSGTKAKGTAVATEGPTTVGSGPAAANSSGGATALKPPAAGGLPGQNKRGAGPKEALLPGDKKTGGFSADAQLPGIPKDASGADSGSSLPLAAEGAGEEMAGATSPKEAKPVTPAGKGDENMAVTDDSVEVVEKNDALSAKGKLGAKRQDARTAPKAEAGVPAKPAAAAMQAREAQTNSDSAAETPNEDAALELAKKKQSGGVAPGPVRDGPKEALERAPKDLRNKEPLTPNHDVVKAQLSLTNAGTRASTEKQAPKKSPSSLPRKGGSNGDRALAESGNQEGNDEASNVDPAKDGTEPGSSGNPFSADNGTSEKISQKGGAAGPKSQLQPMGSVQLGKWRLRLAADSIVPTLPVPDGENDSLETLRQTLLVQQRSRRPEMLTRPVLQCGFAVKFAKGVKPQTLKWRMSPGLKLGAQEEQESAEISWTPSDGPRAGEVVLAWEDGTDAAKISFDSTGRAVVSTRPEMRVYFWVTADYASDDGAAEKSKYTWRVVRGPLSGAAWSSDPNGRQGTVCRLDVVLNGTSPEGTAIALCDRESGWQLETELR